MLKRCPDGLLRREEGAALIEFAAVIPLVLLLMMGIVEYSLVMFGEAVLEGATNNAAREGSTGYVAATCPDGTTPSSQAAYIFCLLSARTAPLLNPANLQMTTMVYPAGYGSVTAPTYNSCNNTGSTNLCSSQQNMGTGGEIVVYTVQYPWHIVTPFLQNVLTTAGQLPGTFMLQASAVVKNEPY